MIFKISKSHIIKEWEAFSATHKSNFGFTQEQKKKRIVMQWNKPFSLASMHFKKNKCDHLITFLLNLSSACVVMSTLHYKVALSDHTDVTGCGTSGSPEIQQLEQSCALGGEWMRPSRPAGQKRLKTWDRWKSDTLSKQKQKGIGK